MNLTNKLNTGWVRQFILIFKKGAVLTGFMLHSVSDLLNFSTEKYKTDLGSGFLSFFEVLFYRFSLCLHYQDTDPHPADTRSQKITDPDPKH